MLYTESFYKLFYRFGCGLDLDGLSDQINHSFLYGWLNLLLEGKISNSWCRGCSEHRMMLWALDATPLLEVWDSSSNVMPMVNLYNMLEPRFSK